MQIYIYEKILKFSLHINKIRQFISLQSEWFVFVLNISFRPMAKLENP